MAKNFKVPKGMPAYSDLINPTVKALQELGGSGNIDEIYNEVLKNLTLPNEIAEFPHSDKSNQTELQYRLAWARTYLKKFGIIENTSRGVWVILPEHRNIKNIDVQKCIAKVQNISGKLKKNAVSEKEPAFEGEGVELPDEIKPWRTRLYNVLHSMNPYAFERLTQRLLRESGFSQVKVTKKSGDGGVDGFGTFMINGIFSFKVAFQCKRYKGSVPVGDIRNCDYIQYSANQSQPV